DGGNAFDATVAAVLTLCTVQSHQVGLGGFGGCLVARAVRGVRREHGAAGESDDSRLASCGLRRGERRLKTSGYSLQPQACSLQPSVIAIDFDSRAPLAFTPEAFADPKDRTIGYRSITVPAILAGLELALKNFGTMSWPQVTA